MIQWPKTRLDLQARLAETTESLWDELSAKMLSEVKEPNESSSETQEAMAEPEEYNGNDPITFIQYKDGRETHFRIPS